MSAKLTESDWKSNSAKCKIRCVDLQKALAAYDRIEEEEHDDLLDTIAEIRSLALDLKKSKEISDNPAAAKYLAEMLTAVEAEQREVSKDKAETEKAAAKDREQSAKSGDEDDDECEGKDSPLGKALLLAMKQLKGNEDLSYEFIVCDAKPLGVIIAKKITPKHKELLTQTTGGKRFLHSGACRFKDGHIVFEPEKPASSLTAKLHESFKHHTGKKHAIKVSNETDEPENGGKLPYALGEDSEVPGKLPYALGENSAPRSENAINPHEIPVTAKATAAPAAAPKPSTVAAAVDTSAGAGQSAGKQAAAPKAAPSGGGLALSGSVGQGGKNKSDDVMAVQKALNARMKLGLSEDGKMGAKTIEAIRNFQKAMGMAKPDGRVDVGRGTARALAGSGPMPPAPPPPKAVAAPKLGKPELAKAPEVWHGMRQVVDDNIEVVKKAIKAHYAHDHPALLKEIDDNLVKLDTITDKLDHRIADSLAKAHAAKDDTARRVELKRSKAILAEYIAYVKGEPLIAHLDANPWVKIDLRKTLINTITHTAQSIGA